jgi:potassium channel subfamily K
LLAATLGPLANVLSIAALVTYWRENIYIDGQYVADFDGVPFKDPAWYATFLATTPVIAQLFTSDVSNWPRPYFPSSLFH